MRLLNVSVGVFAFATGCAVQTQPSSAPRVGIALTDAPAEFESVWVDIARVEISSDSGWLTLSETPQRFDLLTLRNDVAAAIGGSELAPGMYSQLRLVVDDASVVVGGVESSLKIASGAQSGIKVPLDQMIENDMTYAVTLDYDASASIKSTGAGYLMTPVIRVKGVVATPTATDSMDAAPVM